MATRKEIKEAEVIETGVNGEPEVVEPVSVEQSLADYRILPKADQLALANDKGFATPEDYIRSLGGETPPDDLVEVFIPVYDANDIVIPGLGRTVKVRQATIDEFNAKYTAQAGLNVPKFKPRPEDIVH